MLFKLCVIMTFFMMIAIIGCGPGENQQDDDLLKPEKGYCSLRVESDYHSVEFACEGRKSEYECDSKISKFLSKYPNVSCKIKVGYGLDEQIITIDEQKVKSLASYKKQPETDENLWTDILNRQVQKVCNSLTVSDYDSLVSTCKENGDSICDKKKKDFLSKYPRINCVNKNKKISVLEINSIKSSESYGNCGSVIKSDYQEAVKVCEEEDNNICKSSTEEFSSKYPKISCTIENQQPNWKIVFIDRKHIASLYHEDRCERSIKTAYNQLIANCHEDGDRVCHSMKSDFLSKYQDLNCHARAVGPSEPKKIHTLETMNHLENLNGL